MTPDPTDAELDEWERQLTDQEWTQSTRTVVSRLTKALRACRAQSKAKDAVVEQALDSCASKYAEIEHPGWCSRARAALDKEVGDAE